MEIKRNANRAAVLVRQLLAFSRKQTMRPAVLNLTDVVGDLRMLVDRLISGTNVKLDVHTDAIYGPCEPIFRSSSRFS